MQLSIIIVNYNVKYFLEQCLYSVEKACGNIEAEIFVVDNASSDGSRDYFNKRFPGIKFIWLEDNIGFARANNSVLDKAQGEFVLFLNPDTIVAEDTFDTCLSFARRQHKFGALGIRMLDGSGNFLPESKRMFPSVSVSFYKMSGISKLFPQSTYFSKYYAAHIDEHHTGEVEVLAGACMMVSKPVLNITKGFDEDFFMYGEDIDLSYRISKAGFKIFYSGETSIIHFKGESVQKESKSYLKNFYGAMLLFVKKHNNKKRPHVKVAILAAYAAARLKHALLQSNSRQRLYDENKIAIAADEIIFNNVLQIIKSSATPFLIMGRMSVGKQDGNNTLGNLAQMKTIIVKNHLNYVLLVEGDLTFKQIIEIMTSNKKLVSFLIHANNSKSIVGSSDKNRSGFYIAGVPAGQ